MERAISTEPRSSGGTTNNGVVFERSAAGTYSVLYSFKGAPDGGQPNAGVSEDTVGNLYGTTTAGGAYGKGTIYKLTPGGVETVLYSFTGGSDGANIYGGASVDAAGNLYGTAEAGGSLNYGTVWKLSAAGQFTVLHAFAGGLAGDGANPDAGVTLDSQGNLYGTTSMGGATFNLGTVFKVSPGGAYTLLHNFTKVPQTYPESGLAIDAAGNLYGAVEGAVYEVSATGVYTQFSLPPNAYGTIGGTVALGGTGNLYLVTGGAENETPKYGGVFQVNLSSGTATDLYNFPGPPDEGFVVTGGCPEGASASPGVLADAAGNVYGSSQNLGLGGGLFEVVVATRKESTLYRFPAARGGSMPNQIIRGHSGVVFGATLEGGVENAGALFEIKAGVESTLPLPVTILSHYFGQDAEGDLYICGEQSIGGESSVYKVGLTGESTLLYAFADGSLCFGVTADAEGNVYGTTLDGPAPQGQVFRLSNSGEFTSLYAFSGGSDGGSPNPELTLDKEGNVYGTTFYGGTGGGTIFRVTPDGVETVLHDFIPSTGAQPSGDGVALDPEGNIYGATAGDGPNSQGVLYKLSASGDYRVLYAFVGGVEGGGPSTSVALDAAGNIYGTAREGGDLNCSPIVGGALVGCGVVFEFTASGSYLLLHAFAGGTQDGASPSSTPSLDSFGNIYGATSAGGPANCGTIYKIVSGQASSLP